MLILIEVTGGSGGGGELCGTTGHVARRCRYRVNGANNSRYLDTNTVADTPRAQCYGRRVAVRRICCDIGRVSTR